MCLTNVYNKQLYKTRGWLVLVDNWEGAWERLRFNEDAFISLLLPEGLVRFYKTCIIFIELLLIYFIYVFRGNNWVKDEVCFILDIAKLLKCQAFPLFQPIDWFGRQYISVEVKKSLTRWPWLMTWHDVKSIISDDNNINNDIIIFPDISIVLSAMQSRKGSRYHFTL